MEVNRMVNLKTVNESSDTSKRDGSSRTLVYTLVFIPQGCCTLYANEATL